MCFSQGKGGSFCEFYVKVQPDRSVLLESCRYPGQHVTVDPNGKAADTRGHPNAPGKTFYVYVKVFCIFFVFNIVVPIILQV